jgi:hypothetical protein
MRLLKSLITDLTASRGKKVAIHIQELAQETVVAIHAVETQFQSEATKIAVGCRELVIALPRGEEGYDRAYKAYFDLKEKRSALHASAWIASRLILADHAVARAGGDGLPSIGGVALIQGYIETFFRRHDVPGWELPYYDNGFFELHRNGAAAGR